jgi:nicotinate-nucleotide adenylyltransferase
MIGILGGTFDPIHFGHLRPALDCLESLGLREVRFIPLNVAVHRAQPVASSAQRLAMLEAAIGTQPGFVSDIRELDRAGGSFTYDTLLSLREELGPDCPLCLLVGADAFGGFLSWHRPVNILSLAHLVVMRRPQPSSTLDPGLGALYARYGCKEARDLAEAAAGRILFQDVTQMDVSATLVRDLIKKGCSPRYLLPDSVLSIIESERLYR